MKRSAPSRQKKHKTNEEITSPKIRIVSSPEFEDGSVVDLRQALDVAKQSEQDLVEITQADIPICRIIEYSKFLYQLEKKQKNHGTSKKQKQIKLHPNIGSGDLKHKVEHIKEFLRDGHRVEVVCQFSGRENKYKEFGYKLFDEIVTESSAKRDGEVRANGNSIVMYLIRK